MSQAQVAHQAVAPAEMVCATRANISKTNNIKVQICVRKIVVELLHHHPQVDQHAVQDLTLYIVMTNRLVQVSVASGASLCQEARQAVQIAAVGVQVVAAVLHHPQLQVVHHFQAQAGRRVMKTENVI